MAATEEKHFPSPTKSFMRLWTIHPKHLDVKGLVAAWREALLAQAVLLGKTKGYRHHPQLRRFQATSKPAAALATFLVGIHEEAVRRGYRFDASRIGRRRFRGTIPETRGQMLYEWAHLKRKLARRDPKAYRTACSIRQPMHHPLFHLVSGPVQDWEAGAKRLRPVPRLRRKRIKPAGKRHKVLAR